MRITTVGGYTFSLAIAVLAASGFCCAAETPAETPAEQRESPLSTYRPNYILVGYDDSELTNDFAAKFQISLKFRTGLGNLYVAYSQRSFWDITAESSPFSAHNFEPEVFYTFKMSDHNSYDGHLPKLQVGFSHESNGRDGVESRAWNRLYFEPLFTFGRGYFRPTIWAIVSTDDNNSDISDYYGYVDLTLGYLTEHAQRYSATGRIGKKSGSLRLDFSIPIQSFKRFRDSRQTSRFYLQAWYGYGESLLGYDQRSPALRIGLEFHP